MALTPSNMLALGTKAPQFILPDILSGTDFDLSKQSLDKGLVVMFICNHCPYVIHVIEGILEMAKEYQDKGFQFVAINSNDVDRYPQDSPENMKVWAGELNFSFPYLFDASQDVAKAYDAACTPDFYVFNANSELVYRGQMDHSRPGNNIPVTGEDMKGVFNNMLNGKPISNFQKPSMGCGIKWKL